MAALVAALALLLPAGGIGAEQQRSRSQLSAAQVSGPGGSDESPRDPLAGADPTNPARAGRIVARTSLLPGDARGIPYLVFVPSTYTSSREWPMVMGLHGTAGNPQQVLDLPRMQALAEQHGFLVVCPSTSGYYGSSLITRKPKALTVRSDQHLDDVVQRVRREFRVDKDRMFLLGVSLGGSGVWHQAYRSPYRWRALAPITPASHYLTRDLRPIKHLPVLMVQGEKDTAVSVPENRRIAREMKELGMGFTYVEYRGAGHDLSDHDVMGEVFRFFLEHSGPRKRSR